MVVGHGVTEKDMRPLMLDSSSIELVGEFSYLGSLMAEDGRSHVEVDKRIESAPKAFGALRRDVFQDSHLPLATKREDCVQGVCVVGVALW